MTNAANTTLKETEVMTIFALGEDGNPIPSPVEVWETVTCTDKNTGKQLDARRWLNGEQHWFENVLYDSEDREVLRTKKFNTTGGLVTTSTAYDLEGRKVLQSVVGSEIDMIFMNYQTIWEYDPDGSVTVRNVDKMGQTFTKLNADGIISELVWINEEQPTNKLVRFVADQKTLTAECIKGKIYDCNTDAEIGNGVTSVTDGITTFEATICGNHHKMVSKSDIVIEYSINDEIKEQSVQVGDTWVNTKFFTSIDKKLTTIYRFDDHGRVVSEQSDKYLTTYEYSTEEVEA